MIVTEGRRDLWRRGGDGVTEVISIFFVSLGTMNNYISLIGICQNMSGLGTTILNDKSHSAATEPKGVSA